MLLAVAGGTGLLLVCGIAVQRVRRRVPDRLADATERRYRDVVDTQTELICRFLPDATLTFVNEAFCRFWGKPRADLMGSSFLDLLPGEAKEALRACIASAVGGRRQTFEQEIAFPDGTVGCQHWTSHPVYDTDGWVAEIQGVGRDVTGVKRTEEALERSQARYVAILRGVPDLVFVLGPDGRYLDYHARDPRLLFVSPERFLGRTVAEVMPPSLAGRFDGAIRLAAESAEPIVVEYDLPIGGEQRHYEARLVGDGQDRIVAVVRDITDQSRAARALRESESALRSTLERNRVLAGRLIASQETERQRVARDLHDDVGQKVALLNIDIDRCQTDGTLNGKLLTQLRDIAARASEIAVDLHRLSHELHPARLQALGLLASLEALCRDVESRHRITVEFLHADVPSSVEAERVVCVYRIAQEALRNVVKHSAASHARVRLSHQSGNLLLEVEDWGVGFVMDEAHEKGLGLVSMRERAHYLSGKVSVHATPGQGTRVDVLIPLQGVEASRSSTTEHD